MGIIAQALPEYKPYLSEYGNEPKAGYNENLVISPFWRVSVQEHSLDVYATAVTRGGTHSFVSVYADMPTKLELTVTCGYELNSVTVSPLRKNVPYKKVGNNFSLCLTEFGHYVVQANGGYENALTISFSKRCKAPNDEMISFCRGIHEIDIISMEDNTAIYLAEGAILKPKAVSPDEIPIVANDWAGKNMYRDFIYAKNKKGLRVFGEGIIDLSALDWHERRPLVFENCEDISIEGITIVGSPHWTLSLFGCNNVHIDNIRLYGHRENSDGVDIVSSTQVTVQNCFIRTGDDAVCVKAMLKPPVGGGRDITVENCVVWNDKVRCFGIASETVNDIENVFFRNCDIVRSFADWTVELGSLCVVICDSSTMNNISFEDIHIEHELKNALLIKIMKDKWSSDKDAGRIRNISFKNIYIPEGVPSLFEGYDESHDVDGVTMENVYCGGKRVGSARELGLTVNGFVRNIKYR